MSILQNKFFVSPSNLEGKAKQVYDQEISKFLRLFPEVMGIQASQAKPSQFSQYFDAQLDRNLSIYEARVHRAAIQNWYKEQKGQRLFIELPKEKQVAKQIRVLSYEEIELLFHHLGNHMCASLLRLLYTSGLRLDEALYLRRKDINLDSLQIHVPDSVSRASRITTFSPHLREELQLLLKYAEEEDFVFALKKAMGGRKSNPLSRRLPQLYLKNICNEAKLGNITISDLRDNFAIHLLQAGIDWHYLIKLMGFRSRQSMTRYKIYVSPAAVRISTPLDHVLLFRRYASEISSEETKTLDKFG